MTLPKSLTTVTTFSKIIALFLFILLPFVGFYVGYKYREGTYLTTSISVNNPVSIPTPTIDITSWKTYTNSQLGFMVKFPNDLKFTENKGVFIFENEYKLLRKEIPENNYIGITISVKKTSSDISLEDYLKQAYPENKYGVPVFEKNKNDFKEIEIDNIKGLISSKGLSFEDITKTVWVKKGIYVYKISVIGYQTGNIYTKIGEQVFDQILTTFKFTQ